jgi:hypothetical protein
VEIGTSSCRSGNHVACELTSSIVPAIIGSAASASKVGRFETRELSRPENLAAPAHLPGQRIRQGTIVLDMDSSESPTYGEQERVPTTAISAAPVITRYS